MNKTLLILSVLTLGTATISLASQADSAMSGMDRSGMKMPQNLSAGPLSVKATVNPVAPQAGDNTLDLTILDPGGKPATSLKLTATVAMTSMDMGTTHPAVVETGGGHYTTKVNFSMNGPWRVVIRNQASKIAVLNFEAGAKAPWKSPPTKAAGGAPSKADAPVGNPMPALDMSGQANKPAAALPGAGAPQAGAAQPADQSVSNSGASNMEGMDMKGMDMKRMTGIADMKTATVPELQEKGTYTATGDEDWEKQTGFGHNAGMVAMMNQMMVGGSGMEGMKMPVMNMKFDEQNYAKPDADAADNSTPGMNMTAPTTGGALSASTPVKITATAASTPKAGDNPLTISITDAQGKPVTGATITTSVAMTSMDMGTTHPAITEKGSGQYAVTVNFSMAGPWQVKVKVTTPGQKPQTKAFDFTAK